MNEFQYRLQKVIAERRMSAADLSRATGLSSCAISNYINGKYLPKQDKCYAIAQALDVDPGWLLTGVEPTRQPEKVVIPQTEEARFVSVAMDKMPKEERKKAVNVLKAMYGDFFNEAEDKIG